MQSGIIHIQSKDKKLARVIAIAPPCDLQRKRVIDPYRALARSIVYQQLSTKSAAAIYGRFCDLGKGRFPAPQEVLAASEATLRSIGLSRQKTGYLKDLAQKKIDGDLPSSRTLTKLGNEDIIERLTIVKGVGPWSVEMYLMFTLARPDVFPITDYGIQKGFSKLYLDGEQLPTPEQMLRKSRSWAPWRSVAAWYLWRSLEFDL